MSQNIFNILIITFLLLTQLITAQSLQKAVRFGVCADVHKDIMHDADQRLQFFIDQMNEQNVDFIIQLGDFCQPSAKNENFLKIWSSFSGPQHHVLGNHDMDSGFSKEQTVKGWGMPSRYYSFNKGAYHFVILDGNDPSDPPISGYTRYIGAEQRRWLAADLAAAKLPAIVFSHQSMEDEIEGVVNKAEMRKILETAKFENGRQKVIACFSGHHHTDYYRRINGIYYIQINSMSYCWVGGNYAMPRYSEEINRKFPYIKYTVPYKDPLFALVTLEPEGNIKIKGVQSEWVGPSPWELNYPYLHKYDEIVPKISDRVLNYSEDKIEQTPAEPPAGSMRWVNIEPHGSVFENEQKIILTANENDADIRYTLDGKDPLNSSLPYSSPVILRNSCILKTAAFKDDRLAGIVRRAEFYRAQKVKKIILKNQFSPKYPGGGESCLIDFVRGTGGYDDGRWQGYEETGLEAVLDLGKLSPVRAVSAGFLKSEGDWIFLPEWVEFAVSSDGKNFAAYSRIHKLSGQGNIYHAVQEFTDLQARFIRIRAKNIEKCPSDHPGAGGKAWLFADEIIVQ